MPSSSMSVSGGADYRPSRHQTRGAEEDGLDAEARRRAAAGPASNPRTQRIPSGKPNAVMLVALLLIGGCAFFLIPSGGKDSEGADRRHGMGAGSSRGGGSVERLSSKRKGKDSHGRVEDASARSTGRTRSARPSAVRVNVVEFGSEADVQMKAGVHHAQPAHQEEEEDREADPPPGTQRGEWRWTGSIWRKINPKPSALDADRNEISWWERRTVQDRLPFDKFINCPSGTPRAGRERPSLEGIPVRMKWKINDYIVHQGNYEVLRKGANQNRTQRIRRPGLLPPDGDSVLRARPRQWGSCAVVGNSGVLRLTEMNRAIDSHDTVVRINQAPTYSYSRRVGRKVTHRVINRLWTRSYRNGAGMKGKTTLPMEKDLTFMVARATSQEYELLVEFLSEFRPDVGVWYLSSRATTGPGPMLMSYRERLCKAGFGPYKGLNVPSSGFVAILMLLPLCDRVTVYGFGVEGMANRKTDDAFGYHYYKGVGMRHVGDDVHCFDCEEKALQQMGAEGVIDFCTYDPDDTMNSWSCGCRHQDVEECRPPPRPAWLRDTDDCDPGYDDCEELKAQRMARARERERARTMGERLRPAARAVPSARGHRSERG